MPIYNGDNPQEPQDTEESPMEKTINAYLDIFNSKKELPGEIKKKDEAHLELLGKYDKKGGSLTLKEAEEIANSKDEIEGLKEELKEAGEQEGKLKEELKVFLKKVDPKRVKHIRFGVTYELWYSQLKGVMCTEI